VNISDYRREFARPYYHDNSLIRCTETWSLAWIYLVGLGSSLNKNPSFSLTVCNYRGKIVDTQLPMGVSMNRKERKKAAERLAAEIIALAKGRGLDNGNSDPQNMAKPH